MKKLLTKKRLRNELMDKYESALMGKTLWYDSWIRYLNAREPEEIKPEVKEYMTKYCFDFYQYYKGQVNAYDEMIEVLDGFI